MVARATSVNCPVLVDCLIDYIFKMRLPCAQMFTCINDGIYRCCEENSDPKPKKTVKFSDLKKKKKTLPVRCDLESLGNTCPNLTRTMHLNALYQAMKCCKSAAIFSSQIRAPFRTQMWVEQELFPAYH